MDASKEVTMEGKNKEQILGNFDLNKLREEIDMIDSRLSQDFQKRMEVCREVGEFKKAHGMRILDPKREAEKLKNYEGYTKDFFNELMAISRKLQRDNMKNAGLIGAKLGHSYSVEIHEKIGLYNYELIETPSHGLKDILENKDYIGFNVTIPYKKSVMEFCDLVSPLAEKIGAVNTIFRDEEGRLVGHNTDYFGFDICLKFAAIEVKDMKCLVLGSGGAGNMVRTYLKANGAREVITVSRGGQYNYQNLNLLRDADIIINTTPIGMYPYNGKSPIDLEQFSNLKGIVDLIYNPLRTKLVLEGQKRKIKSIGGLVMLVAQALLASKYFLGQKTTFEEVSGQELDDILKEVNEIYQELLAEKENLALIGMPGAGKSFLGKLYALEMNRRFVDIDDEIVKLAGKSIVDIFDEDGEEEFRRLETLVLSRFAKESGLVIATGGGVVTRGENKDILKENSHVLWIETPLELLDTSGRPISQIKSVEEIFKEREKLYKDFADEKKLNQF